MLPVSKERTKTERNDAKNRREKQRDSPAHELRGFVHECSAIR
jgi:hypothetical protein